VRRDVGRGTAAALPQADASTLVDRATLDEQVQAMYRNVARDPFAPRHFETGRNLALRLGYPELLLASVPYEALASFAGVGYHLDLADLRPGDRVLDLGAGSGTDAFCAAISVGPTGTVVGVDFTDAQIENARRLAERNGIDNVRFVEASIDGLPFDDGSFDVVACRVAAHHFPDILAAVKEMARVTRGRVVVADLLFVSESAEEAERVRDPSHVRNYGADEWRSFYELAGLDVVEQQQVERRQEFEPWLERAGCTGEEAARVRELSKYRIVDGWISLPTIVIAGKKRTT
jgi:arsenite methyltransferase